MLQVIDIQWYTRRWSLKLQYFWKPTNTENLVSITNTDKSSYKGNKPRFNSFTCNLLLFPVHSKSSIIDVLMSHSPREKNLTCQILSNCIFIIQLLVFVSIFLNISFREMRLVLCIQLQCSSCLSNYPIFPRFT